MINYFQIVLLMIFPTILSAQPIYIDDLDKEFRYKVDGVDLQDRGIYFFKKDIEAGLNKSKSFKEVRNYAEKASFTIQFYDKTKLDNIGVFVINGQPIVGNRKKKWGELGEILNSLIGNWKPAEYRGEVYKYNQVCWVSFNIHCNDKGGITISEINFSSSKERYMLDSSCFKTIEPKSIYEDPFFYSTEIHASYKGGSEMLKSNLNALLNPVRIENATIDYFTIDFVITRAKQLAFFNNPKSSDEVEVLVAEKMKLLSCNWNPAIQGGRSVNLVLSYKFYYSYMLDENQKRVNINILDIITQDVLLKTKIEQTF